jgi:protein-S-isoprenylcysteine O-methyltransferase Ste14
VNVGASPWIILFAIFVYGAIHSWLASTQAKALAQRWFGKAAERGYRLAYNLFAGITLLPVLALPVLLPDRQIYALQAPWIYAALAVQGLALVALVIGLWQTGVWSFLGIEQLFQPQPNVNKKLVVRGLYRWVRHPLYTAGLAFICLEPGFDGVYPDRGAVRGAQATARVWRGVRRVPAAHPDAGAGFAGEI